MSGGSTTRSVGSIASDPDSDGECAETSAVLPWYASEVAIHAWPPVAARPTRRARSFASEPAFTNITWSSPGIVVRRSSA